MPMPKMQPVNSSSIAALGYDPENQCVYVRFHHGLTYAYQGVPVHEYESLRTATSIGAHFNRNFRDVYPYERV